jgi:hypothetical protein
MYDDNRWAGTDVEGDGYDVSAVVRRDGTLPQNYQLTVFLKQV